MHNVIIGCVRLKLQDDALRKFCVVPSQVLIPGWVGDRLVVSQQLVL